MNKNKFFVITTIVLLIANLFLIGFLFLHKPGKGMHTGPEKMIISKLDFDNQQTASYLELIKGHKLAAREVDDQILKVKTLLYGELGAGETTPARDSLFQVLHVNLSKREMIHYNHFKDIKKLCTPTQLPAFAKLMSEVQGIFMRRKPGHRKPSPKIMK